MFRPQKSGPSRNRRLILAWGAPRSLMHRMSSRPELRAQTSLRGIAALTVFIAHAEFYRLFPQAPLFQKIYNVFFWHNVAVDLFFELSGFILCYVYLSKPFTWTQYAMARFSRIYPLYLAGIAAYLVMNTAAWIKTGVLSQGLTFGTLFTNLFLVQCWPLLPTFTSINQPTWSISVEVFLYLFLFPILCLSQRHVSPRLKMALVVLPVTLLACIYLFGDPMLRLGGAPLSPYRGILCFTSGFFMCTLGLASGFAGIPKKIEFGVLLVMLGCLLFQFPLNRSYAVLGFPFLAYFTADALSLSTRLLDIPLLCWLGDLSYSIYVWHYPMIKAVTLALGLRTVGQSENLQTPPSTAHSLLYMAVLVIAVLTISHLSHFYFERPVAKWLRRGRKP